MGKALSKDERAVWLARALIGLCALAAFGPAVQNGLVPSWDDGRFLVDFAPVQSISWAHFVTIVSEVHFEAWHPVHLLSYWLDVPWAGASGPALHATSLALWVFALWLVFEVFRRLGLPLVPAVLGVLAFGLHPVQVEAVTWATGRKEILALAFACACILAHLASERWTDRAAWMARLFYVLALMSKTTVLPLPGLLFLVDVLLRDIAWKEALRRQIPLVVVGGVFGALVLSIWREHEMIRGEGTATSAALVAATYAHHMKVALLPTSLSVVYPIHRGGALPASGWVGPALLLVGIGVALKGKRRRAAFALSAFALLLIPVSNVVPVYFQFQDRYLSLPLLGLAFGFGALAANLSERVSGSRLAVLGLGGILVLLLAGRTVQYGREWAGDLRLWGHAASTQPEAYYAWLNLGHVRRDAGQLATAIEAYDEAIEVAPSNAVGYGGRFSAVALKDERDYGAAGPDAIALGSRFVREGDDPDALRLLAGQLAEHGYRNAVLMALGRSLDMEPIDDERLERAAQVQHERGHSWLARFYVERMSREPFDDALRGYGD